MADALTDTLTNAQRDLEKASLILSNGGLVAFPTETVYGLGADAKNGQAVAKVYAAKGRPGFNPLIVHVAHFEIAKRFAVFSTKALELAETFWPGPLSLVLPLAKNHGLSELVTAGLDSVAIRVPQHPVAQALLKQFNGPLAAPSANMSGHISPTQAAHVIADMNGKVDAVIDGGQCAVGVESTILKVTGDHVTLLRSGGVPGERIAELAANDIAVSSDPKSPQSPGQLQSHYAPHASVRMNAAHIRENEILLGFGPDCADSKLNLSPSGDLIEAAANLFAYLRELDRMNPEVIAVSPVPMSGLGIAINDRLKRAAAPRDNT